MDFKVTCNRMGTQPGFGSILRLKSRFNISPLSLLFYLLPSPIPSCLVLPCQRSFLMKIPYLKVNEKPSFLSGKETEGFECLLGKTLGDPGSMNLNNFGGTPVREFGNTLVNLDCF